MIVFSEAKVLAPSIGSRRQLKFTLTVKPEDITEENQNLLWQAYENGTPVAIVMEEFSETPEDGHMKRKRLELDQVIRDYCEANGSDKEEEVKKVRDRHMVKSRKEMTEAELDEEIERYVEEMKARFN